MKRKKERNEIKSKKEGTEMVVRPKMHKSISQDQYIMQGLFLKIYL
jgi:hypothetical protein